MKHIIVNADGLVINVIEWDGTAKWSPPEGGTAIKSEHGSSGDTFIRGKVIPAPVPKRPPEVPPPPTFQELVAEASTFADLKRLVAAQLA